MFGLGQVLVPFEPAEFMLRRIADGASWLKWDSYLGSCRPTRGAFKDKPMSVDRTGLFPTLDEAVAHTLRDNPDFGVMAISYAALRGLGLPVNWSPTAANQAHCDVGGPRSPGLLTRVANEFNWIKQPPYCSDLAGAAGFSTQ